MIQKLPPSFFQHADVIAISKELLGKVLVTNFDGTVTAGVIVETEAYKAPEDKASHAYNNRRTVRTETMFNAGAVAYVYLCYGMHHLFNIVTGPKDTPHAVLIRAIAPVDGLDLMLARRRMSKLSYKLTAGPGKLSQALGIKTIHNGQTLTDSIFVQDAGAAIPAKEIVAVPRIGIAYAKEYADKPWRFYIKGNPWVSKP